MRGSVYKRGKGWTIQVEQGYESDGKRRRIYESGFKTKKKAEARLDELKRELRDNAYVEPSKQTVDAYLIEEWLPGIKLRGDVRASTVSSYEMLIRQHIVPKVGATRLQALNVKHINGLYVHLLNAGRTDGRGGLAPKTVRNVHQVLRKALADAVRSQTLNRNPAEFASPPSVRSSTEKEMKTWDALQLRDFLSSMEGDRLYALFVLLASTGMRRGEALGLRWRDVDLDPPPPARPHLKVVQTLVTVDYAITFSTPKTKKGKRSLDLDERTLAILRSHKKRQLEERMQVGSAYEDLGLVFTKLDGSPLHPDFVSQTFDRAVKRGGLPRIRLHDLRHTYATISLSSGVHPKVVSERLGHATVAFTLDVYSHSVPALQAEAAERIAALIFGDHR